MSDDGLLQMKLQSLTEQLVAAEREIATLRADRDAALEREMRAVAKERERCADIASWHGGHAGNPAVWQYGDMIAEAIRRGE